MTDKYNGWTNYETWNAALWMDSDNAAEIASEYDNIADLADALKEMYAGDDIQEINNLPTTGMFADLLGAAISSINWYEIAEHYEEDLSS